MVLILFVGFSCSEDDPDPLVKEGEGVSFKISELAGNWEATYANFNDGVQQSVNVVGDGGTVSISVQSSGKFTLTIDPVDLAAYTISGEMFWELFEGKYYFAIAWDDYPGDWDTYGVTLAATTFTISGGVDSAEYDFDNDGTFEACSLSMEFVRV